MADDRTIYFAWVDPGTPFSSALERVDEQILSFEVAHEEGQIPTMRVEIKNPLIPLLSHARKVWAWLSTSDGVTTTPHFFGRLVGYPSDVIGLTLTLDFIARSDTYIADKQAVAETLKTLPYWDPIFIDIKKRDDPDTIIEGWSALYHVDRTSLAITVSDVLIGEDGTVDFAASDVFYDSLKTKFLQSPLAAVNVVADVTWRQQTYGALAPLMKTFSSYTGDAIINGWPQPGADIGQGWKALVGFATENTGVERTQLVTTAFSFQNESKSHQNGDTMSLNWTLSQPLVLNASSQTPPSITYSTLAPTGGQFIAGPVYYQKIIQEIVIEGQINPNAVDLNGDPAPLMIPASEQIQTYYIPLWQVAGTLTLRYDADRERRERINFTLESDIQQILVDPLVTQNTETIRSSGSDVSEPIIELTAWTAVAGRAVALGTIIFPNNPTVAGQNSAQIAVHSGTAGTVEPIFSNVPGVETTDGTVIWASLGDAGPTDSPPDWTPYQNVNAGSMLLPRVPFCIPEQALLLQSEMNWPPGSGIAVPYGTYLSQAAFSPDETTGPGFSPDQYQNIVYCIDGGEIGYTFNEPPTLVPIFTDGQTMYVCSKGGQTGQAMPVFNPAFGAVTSEAAYGGTAEWTSIGPVSPPIGGWPGNIINSKYFPSARGGLSAQNRMMAARAKLRWRARAVQVSWESPFAEVMGLSCRMNAIVNDSVRLAIFGGQAAGKVVSYKLICEAGKSIEEGHRLFGQVTIGCSIGNGNDLATTAGTPEWVSADWVDPGWQQYDGAIVAAASSDVGYTPPYPQTVDDGLVFPLTNIMDVVVQDQVHGTLQNQEAAIQEGVEYAIAAATAAFAEGQQLGTQYQMNAQYLAALASVYSPNALLARAPIWWEFVLKPLQNGPFLAEYVLKTTKVSIERTINLGDS